MAKTTKSTAEIRKAVLIGATSRIELSQAHSRFRDRWDLPGRVKDEISSSPVKWLGGSAVVGFLLSALFKKKKPAPTPARVKVVKTERNFLVGILAILIAVAKPIARIYATKFLKNYLQRRVQRRYLGEPKEVGVRPY